MLIVHTLKLTYYGLVKKKLKHRLAFVAIVLGAIVAGCFLVLKLPYEMTALPAAAIVPQQEVASTTGQAPIIVQSPLFNYIEIIGGCDWSYTGTCVNMRSGPGTQFPIVTRLRTGIVLKVEASTTAADGHNWYKVIFDGEIRYPERVKGDWYVADDAEDVRPFTDNGDSQSKPGVVASTTKRIVVNLSHEMLYAYDGDTLFMEEPISTGLEMTPTLPGHFTVYKKTPSRYMQGPIPGVSDQDYDLPGVPWNLYFTVDGAVIHGAYWHNHFGEPWSHGCVNLPPDQAQKLYQWTVLGTPVTVER